jgi:hypothetical protein
MKKVHTVFYLCVDSFDDISQLNGCLEPLYALPRGKIHQRYPFLRKRHEQHKVTEQKRETFLLICVIARKLSEQIKAHYLSA